MEEEDERMNTELQKDSEKNQKPEAPKKCGQLKPQGLGISGREAILDDIQANWSRLPAPPSAVEVNRWIKAGRQGE
jgi:hypothetical protein